MNSLAIAAISLACSCAGGAIGLLLRPRLPESCLSDDSKEVVKLGAGLIGTMAALVLGLLVASAASAFNTEDDHVQQLATDFVLLDRGLAHYGPEASDARAKLRVAIATLLDHLWPTDPARSPGFDAPEITSAGGALFDAVRDLVPRNDAQRLIQSRSIQISGELARTRLTIGQGAESSIPAPFLVVLMFWLAVLFVGFGLLSARNAIVIAVIVLCALSVSAALFLILDLDQPFDGMIRISGAALRAAQSQLGR